MNRYFREEGCDSRTIALNEILYDINFENKIEQLQIRLLIKDRSEGNAFDDWKIKYSRLRTTCI